MTKKKNLTKDTTIQEVWNDDETEKEMDEFERLLKQFIEEGCEKVENDDDLDDDECPDDNLEDDDPFDGSARFRHLGTGYRLHHRLFCVRCLPENRQDQSRHHCSLQTQPQHRLYHSP